MTKNIFTILLMAALCQGVECYAQIKDSVALDEIVVTANHHRTLRRKAPVLINIVNRQIFNAAQSPTLCEALPYQIGVRVEDNCESCGYKQARINGLDGHYSQILIDSQPVFSALSSVYGLELVPENLIERVEVMRGGGSALYGSSAVGGTINIITRVPNINSASISHSLMGIGGGNTFENNTEISGSATTENHKMGLFVFGQYHSRQGYDSNGDGITELPKLNAQTFGGKTFLRVGDYQHFDINFLHTESTHRGGSDLELQPDQASLSEMAQHNITQGGIDFDSYSADGKQHLNIYSSIMTTRRNSYSGGKAVDDNPSLYFTRTSNLLWANGAHYDWDIEKLLFMPSEITVGAEYSYDNLKDKYLGFNYSTRQIQRIVGVLAQNEWKNEQWSLLAGIRADKSNLVDHIILSPRINIRYNPSTNVNFRFGYSDGFRAPQTFDEDLHVDMAGAERFRVQNVKGLKEERSHSITLSTDLYRNFDNIRTNLMIECFYTQLNHAFAIRNTDKTDADGTTIRERYNSSNAHVAGINIEAKINIDGTADFDAGFTMQQSRYSNAQQWSDDESVKSERKMFRAPDCYGYLSADIHPTKHWDISATGTYTGSMLIAHAAGSGVSKDIAVNTPQFLDAGLRTAYSFQIVSGVKAEAAIGVKNIFDAYQDDFDRGVNRDSDYIYGPSLPRSYYGSLKLSF
jgi:outer membrane receptor for ferrienterochelin and colicins